GAELQERSLKSAAPSDRVPINPRQTQLRELLAQQIFYLLAALAHIVNVLTLTSRTMRRRWLAMIAVVADDDAFAAMISQRHITVGAVNGLAAGTAQNETGIAATINQNDRLLLAIVGSCNRFQQLVGKNPRPSVLRKDLAHIDDLGAREWSTADAFR